MIKDTQPTLIGRIRGFLISQDFRYLNGKFYPQPTERWLKHFDVQPDKYGLIEYARGSSTQLFDEDIFVTVQQITAQKINVFLCEDGILDAVKVIPIYGYGDRLLKSEETLLKHFVRFAVEYSRFTVIEQSIYNE